MPCRSDYPEDYPSEAQRKCHKAGVLLVELKRQLNLSVTTEETRAAQSECYFSPLVEPALCALLKGMSKKQFKATVYNPYKRFSRDLADWWEQHLEDDRRHRVEDLLRRKRAKIRRQALAKLTLAERKSLGI